MNFLDASALYVSIGFNVFPLKTGSKEPATKHGVHDATDDADALGEYARRLPDANIAVGCGPGSGITVIDVDKHHGGVESLKALIKQHGDIPKCPMAQTPQGGFHLYFANDARIGNSQNVLGKGIDVKAKGGYVVLPPSHWDGCKKGEKVSDGGPYKWVRAPLGPHMPPMPEWMLRRLLPKPMPKFAPTQWDKSNADLAQVAKALKFVPNHDYGTWTMVGMALKAEFGDEAFDLWCSWSSAGYSKFDPKECRQKWRSFRRSDGVGIGSVFRDARMGGADLKTIFGERGGLAA